MTKPDFKSTAADAVTQPVTNSPARIVSVDAYRGLVMFLMMAEVLELKNVSQAIPTSEFWKFLAWHQTHVPWAGCTLHDLIQPSFSFLVGVALPFSLAHRTTAGSSRGRLILHACWRAFLLTALGIFLRSMGKSQTNFTFDDTLTQIGLGYVPLFCLGLVSQRWQWAALIVILVGYWGAFVAYPLPSAEFDYAAVGVPADWPYHYQGLAAHWNKNSNLAWAFDTWWMNLFARPEVWKFHPGGYATLSFIPTLGTMILGLIAGGWLKQTASAWQKVLWFVLSGVVLLSLGYALHLTGICPSIKRIWTPSWILYSGGWCFLFLACFYAVIDAAGWQAWAYPWRVIGANSIVAYCLAHGSEHFIASSFQTHLGPQIFQIFGAAYEPVVAGFVVLLVWWLILVWMFRQRVLVRI